MEQRCGEHTDLYRVLCHRKRFPSLSFCPEPPSLCSLDPRSPVPLPPVLNQTRSEQPRQGAGARLSRRVGGICMLACMLFALQSKVASIFQLLELVPGDCSTPKTRQVCGCWGGGPREGNGLYMLREERITVAQHFKINITPSDRSIYFLLKEY